MTDYYQVDTRLGSNQTLKDVIARAHERGWHVLLDGVFKHTGIEFFAFKSLLEQQEKSPHKDWYLVQGFPVEVKEKPQNYEGWYGFPEGPKLNMANKEVRAYMLEVAAYW